MYGQVRFHNNSPSQSRLSKGSNRPAAAICSTLSSFTSKRFSTSSAKLDKTGYSKFSAKLERRRNEHL